MTKPLGRKMWVVDSGRHDPFIYPFNPLTSADCRPAVEHVRELITFTPSDFEAAVREIAMYTVGWGSKEPFLFDHSRFDELWPELRRRLIGE